MARPMILDLKKDIHSNHLPPLVKCLPVTDGKPPPYGLSSFLKSEKVKRPCYRERIEKSEGCKESGMPSLFNVMWDPRVRRGPTFKTFQEDAAEQCEFLSKAKKQPRRKKIVVQPRKVGGIAPWPPVVPESDHMTPNLDQFLVEYIAELKFQDMSSQTPDSCDVPKCFKREFLPGVNVSTQIKAGDLFDKEEMMGLINETIVEKISEQAIMELMEEEEISALTKFENELHEKEMVREGELARIEGKEQLELFEAKKIEEKVLKEAEGEREIQTLVSMNCFSRATVEGIKERLWPWLEKMGYAIDCVQLNIERQFIPWLNHMVLGEIEHRGISNEILDDIVTAVTLKRQYDILDPLMATLQVDYFRTGGWMDGNDEEESDSGFD